MGKMTHKVLIACEESQKGWFEMDNPNSNPYSEENEFELYNAYNKGYEQGLLDSACKVFENSKRVNKARKIATWEWVKDYYSVCSNCGMLCQAHMTDSECPRCHSKMVLTKEQREYKNATN